MARDATFLRIAGIVNAYELRRCQTEPNTQPTWQRLITDTQSWWNEFEKPIKMLLTRSCSHINSHCVQH